MGQRLSSKPSLCFPTCNIPPTIAGTLILRQFYIYNLWPYLHVIEPINFKVYSSHIQDRGGQGHLIVYIILIYWYNRYPILSRRPWTNEEDERLIRYVEAHGAIISLEPCVARLALGVDGSTIYSLILLSTSTPLKKRRRSSLTYTCKLVTS